MRVPVGGYKITFYDGYGAVMRKETLPGESQMSSIAVGNQVLQERHITGDLDSPTSFTVDRRLYNSLDPHANLVNLNRR